MIKYLLPLLLLSCTLEEVEPVELPEVETIEITEEGIDIVYTLHGIYRRSIGSQYEVYDIGKQFVIYIQTGDDYREIYRADYTYTDSEIIIGSDRFGYILYIDRVEICGYTYYRQGE